MYNTGQVLGASSAVAGGIAVLPNTSGSFTLTLVAILSIVTGLTVLVSLAATKLYKKFSK